MQRILRWLNETAYFVSVPFLMLLLIGVVLSNRPLAVLGATAVVLLNIGRLIAGVANLVVIPFREGIVQGVTFLIPPFTFFYLNNHWKKMRKPTRPRPTPIPAPSTPRTNDSPITWAMIRRPRQPSAFSVPNSRTRRATASIVSSTATANAAISTRIGQPFAEVVGELRGGRHRAGDLAGQAARRGDRGAGSTLAISLCTAEMSAALAAVT